MPFGAGIPHRRPTAKSVYLTISSLSKPTEAPVERVFFLDTYRTSSVCAPDLQHAGVEPDLLSPDGGRVRVDLDRLPSVDHDFDPATVRGRATVDARLPSAELEHEPAPGPERDVDIGAVSAGLRPPRPASCVPQGAARVVHNSRGRLSAEDDSRTNGPTSMLPAAGLSTRLPLRTKFSNVTSLTCWNFECPRTIEVASPWPV